jgi:hypothetical protein
VCIQLSPSARHITALAKSTSHTRESISGYEIFFSSFTLDRISKVFSKFGFNTSNVCIEFCSLLRTFVELPKATFGLITYVSLFVRMEQFVLHRTEYDEDLSIIYRGNSVFIKI